MPDMNAPAPGGAPAPSMPDQSQSPAQEGNDPISETLYGMNDQLMMLQKVASDSPQAIPPEATKHLQTAVSEYQQFLDITGQAMGLPGQASPAGGAMGNSPADVQGKAGAMPADMPMRKGAVPA